MLWKVLANEMHPVVDGLFAGALPCAVPVLPNCLNGHWFGVLHLLLMDHLWHRLVVVADPFESTRLISSHVLLPLLNAMSFLCCWKIVCSCCICCICCCSQMERLLGS